MNNSEVVDKKDRAKYEWQSFLFIVIFLFPILSVVIVGGVMASSYGQCRRFSSVLPVTVDKSIAVKLTER